MVVLVVDTASQIIAAVVVGIVSAEHRIFHIEVGFETVAVIDGSDKTYFPSGRKAAYAAYIGAYAQIADRVHGAYLPVVVESVSLQVDTVAGYGFECGVHTTVEMAQTVVESQKSVLLPLLCLKSWKWVASLMFPPTDSVKLFSAGRSLVVSRMNPPLKSAGYSGAGDFTMAMFSSCELGMMSKENARESASVLGTALPLIQTLL